MSTERSDVPEHEIFCDFPLDKQDRRVQERRRDYSPCQDQPCISLIVTENRLTQLANEFYSYRRERAEEVREESEERQEILSKLNKIDNHLDRQKGFFAGVVWLGASLISTAGVIAAVVDFFKQH